MKRAILILIGLLLPLLIGFLLSNWSMGWQLFLRGRLNGIGLAVLALWFVTGMISMKFFTSKREALLLLNTAPILIALLVLFQILVLGRFLGNIVGMASQFFYLPLMGLTSGLLSVLPLPVISMTMISFVSLGLLILASWFGICFGKSRA